MSGVAGSAWRRHAAPAGAACRPRNPIGWLTLIIVFVGFTPTSQYLILDYRMHYGTLPLGGPVVVLQECWPLFLFLILLLLWLFPDGRLPAGRCL